MGWELCAYARSAEMKIAAVCGSLQRRSGNRLLIEDAVIRAPVDFRWSHLEMLSVLPYFNPDLKKDAASVPSTERGLKGIAVLCDTLLAVDAQILWREPIARGAGYERQVDAMLVTLHDAL